MFSDQVVAATLPRRLASVAMEQQVVDAFLAANDMFRRLAQTAPGMLPAGRKAQIQALKELVRKLSDPLDMRSVASIFEALAS